MKTVLLKLTGQALANKEGNPDTFLIKSIAQQLKQLMEQNYRFGVVIGGGNIFRGSTKSRKLGIRPSQAHQIGMLATAINGLIIADIFNQESINTSILTAFDCPQVGSVITNENINKAFKQNNILIFVGGTGCPYFTTDTAAVIRALQINAHVIWKATKINGLFDKDPEIYENAKKIDRIDHQQVIEQNLKIMDQTAFILAAEHKIPIQFFSIFEPNALLNAAQDDTYASRIDS